MIGAIVTRLIALCPSLADVVVAEDAAALDKGTALRSGTAIVIPYRERARPNTLIAGGHRQAVETQILVALLGRLHGDVRGAERAMFFDACKGEIETALAGWAPADDAEAFSLIGGEGSAMGNGVSIYVQTWQTVRFLTGA